MKEPLVAISRGEEDAVYVRADRVECVYSLDDTLRRQLVLKVLSTGIRTYSGFTIYTSESVESVRAKIDSAHHEGDVR